MKNAPPSDLTAPPPDPDQASASPAAPGPQPGVIAEAQAMHDRVSAQFDLFAKGWKGLEATKKSLDQLLKMGNAITAEDVIKAAGKQVAGGYATAVQMATILSQMPTQDGAQLAAWVQQQDQMIAQREAQFAPLFEQARHALATSGLRVLQAHHVSGLARAAMQPQAQAQSSAPGNDLASMPAQGTA